MSVVDRGFMVMSRPKGETPEHLQLKQIAIDFLAERGCTNIKTEVWLSRSPHYGCRGDVVGYRDGVVEVVECGGSFLGKLLKLERLAGRIFILPYGKKVPFLWDKSIIVCNACGNFKKAGK